MPVSKRQQEASRSAKEEVEVLVVEGHAVDKKNFERLYPYQQDGVRFMLNLFNKSSGTPPEDPFARIFILADDMGMGKTVQVVTFLATLLLNNKIKTVLIVLPNTLISVWCEEFRKWYGRRVSVEVFHNPRTRMKSLQKVQREGGVLLTTYAMAQSYQTDMNTVQQFREMIESKAYGRMQSEVSKEQEYNVQDLQALQETPPPTESTLLNKECSYSELRKESYSFNEAEDSQNKEEDQELLEKCTFTWDYLVLDEAHKSKNPSNTTTKALNEINTRHRIAITGTPVQNNLKEMHTLFEFANGVLGTYREFNKSYEKPILASRKKGAETFVIEMGNRKAEQLRRLFSPYLLRRTKEEMHRNLPTKYDWVVWISLAPVQFDLYYDCLETKRIKEIIQEHNRQDALIYISRLKLLCDHPRMLPVDAIHEIANMSQRRSNNVNSFLSSNKKEKSNIKAVSIERLRKESSKLVFLIQLVTRLKAEKHRTLIFSQCTQMLDIIERLLKAKKFKLVRLDGKVRNLNRRSTIVQDFQTKPSIDICLLTTQVGGVGLTLTAADRVIIYDPCWNPETDAQAIDRAYRIGQTKDVVVYRLITCGTVEEKIFRRQINKRALTKQMIEQQDDPIRYFSTADLMKLFEFSGEDRSKTFEMLIDMHGESQLAPHIDAHRTYLKRLPNVCGVSDHSLLYSDQLDGSVNDVSMDRERTVLTTNSPADHQHASQRQADATNVGRAIESTAADSDSDSIPRLSLEERMYYLELDD